MDGWSTVKYNRHDTVRNCPWNKLDRSLCFMDSVMDRIIFVEVIETSSILHVWCTKKYISNWYFFQPHVLNGPNASWYKKIVQFFLILCSCTEALFSFYELKSIYVVENEFEVPCDSAQRYRIIFLSYSHTLSLFL